jgi:Tat protein translocase TatB subunit
VFDVGFTELLLIGIVALVVIGPERLPAVAKTAGQWIAKLQKFVRGVKTDIASELESGDLKKLIGDQREQINELLQMVNTAKKEFESNARETVQDARKSLADMESSVKVLDDHKGADPGGLENSEPKEQIKAGDPVKSLTSVGTADPHPPGQGTNPSTPLVDSASMDRTGTESGT